MCRYHFLHKAVQNLHISRSKCTCSDNKLLSPRLMLVGMCRYIRYICVMYVTLFYSLKSKIIYSSHIMIIMMGRKSSQMWAFSIKDITQAFDTIMKYSLQLAVYNWKWRKQEAINCSWEIRIWSMFCRLKAKWPW